MTEHSEILSGQEHDFTNRVVKIFINEAQSS